MLIKLDLHVHTAQSPDSTAPLADMLREAKKKGLSGIAVTDHNVFALPDRPKADRHADMIVIPGCEYSTDAGHMLAYFIRRDAAEGLSKDSKGVYPFQEILARVHEQGGLLFMAHPFAPAIERDDFIYRSVDGIEVYNARIEHTRVAGCNKQAQDLCGTYRLPFAAGSDAHLPEEVGAAYWACDIETGGKSYEQILLAIKNALLQKRGTLYGGTASPLCRPKSQFIRLRKSGQARKAFKLLPRFARAFLQSLRPVRKPEPIFPLLP